VIAYACCPNTKLYYRTDEGTTATTYSSSDLGGSYEIDNSQLVVVVSEPKQEADDQEEPDTGERPVIKRLPNRRLPTVNRAERPTYPRRWAPPLVPPGRQWSRHHGG